MSRLILSKILSIPLQPAFFLLQLLLLQRQLNLFLILQLPLLLDYLHLASPHLLLPLLEPAFHELTQVNRALLDLLERLPELLLLSQLLFEVLRLTVELSLLLLQLVLVLALLGLQFGRVVHLHLETLTCDSLLMGLQGLFFLGE